MHPDHHHCPLPVMSISIDEIEVTVHAALNSAILGVLASGVSVVYLAVFFVG